MSRLPDTHIFIALLDGRFEQQPEPSTRDPFDRLLLAQCAIENMRLVTIDRALADHPLSATAGL